MWLHIILPSLVVLSSIFNPETHDFTNDESQITNSESNSANLLKRELMPQLSSDYMKSDAFFQRWLKSNDFDVPKTRRNLQKFIDWRRNNVMDRERRDLTAEHEMPIQILQDKLGQPVLYYDMSKTNLRKVVEENPIETYAVQTMRAIDKACEIINSRQQSGTNITQLGFLIDWTGFNREKHLCPRCVPVYSEIVKYYEAYYPLSADRLVYFNTPPAFKDVIAMIRPLMSEQLSKSFVTFGRDELSLAKDYLEDWIGKDNLPSSIQI